MEGEGVPHGWEIRPIGDEVEAVGGSTPSTTNPGYWNGEFHWATPKDLSSLQSPVLFGTERRITQAGLDQISSGLLPGGTVLLSSRAPIGYLAITEVPTSINQGFIALVCRARLSNVFAWLWCSLNMDTVLQHANGSTFLEISKRSFRPLPVVVPSPPVLRAFDVCAKPLHARIAANERENLTLAQMRDLLLPKLMSGEIRIKDAEKAVAELL
jgi:type I restriction enzyme S subunit